MNDLKETEDTGTMKREALDCNLWRICCGRGCGPVLKTDHRIMSHIRQTEHSSQSGNRTTFHVYPSRSLSQQDKRNILPLQGTVTLNTARKLFLLLLLFVVVVVVTLDRLVTRLEDREFRLRFPKG
jgi:hypothetical protein